MSRYVGEVRRRGQNLLIVEGKHEKILQILFWYLIMNVMIPIFPKKKLFVCKDVLQIPRTWEDCTSTIR